MRKTIALIPLLLVMAAGCTRGGDEPSPPAGPAAPKVGSVAPSFILPAANGGTVSLADYRGEQPVLLYFSMGPG
jgi:hypothetical protein